MLSNTATNERPSFFFLGTMLPVASIALGEGKRSLPLLSLHLDKGLLCSTRGWKAAGENEERHDHHDNGQNAPAAEGILHGQHGCLLLHWSSHDLDGAGLDYTRRGSQLASQRRRLCRMRMEPALNQVRDDLRAATVEMNRVGR